MLAYAANAPRTAERRSSPNALLAQTSSESQTAAPPR